MILQSSNFVLFNHLISQFSILQNCSFYLSKPMLITFVRLSRFILSRDLFEKKCLCLINFLVFFYCGLEFFFPHGCVFRVSFWDTVRWTLDLQLTLVFIVGGTRGQLIIFVLINCFRLKDCHGCISSAILSPNTV